MKAVYGYSIPFLLTLSGAVSTLSDILQKPGVAYVLALCLIVVSGLVLISSRSAALSDLIQNAIPRQFRKTFSAPEFSISCSIMAALVFGFATLSARASEDGGIIAHAYPEIRELQANLGVVQKTVSDIALRARQIDETTREINAAADKWIGVTELSIYSPDAFLMHISVENRSTFLFDNVRIVARLPQLPPAINESDFTMAPNSQEQYSREFQERPEIIEVCVSGQRRNDGVWSREIRTYGNPSTPEEGIFFYRIVYTKGIEVVTADSQCA